jgi:UDP-N-acetylglucosamine transferase subunit ALG13
MIFVTVGSTDFDALTVAMDELAPSLGTRVVMQVGLGAHVPANAEYFRFAPSLDHYYDDAELVVGHGGYGTVVEALERGKRLVCVVNPTTYDRHQEHLLRVLEEQGCLLWCREVQRLGEAIAAARVKQFEVYQPPECHIHETIIRHLLS